VASGSIGGRPGRSGDQGILAIHQRFPPVIFDRRDYVEPLSAVEYRRFSETLN
jgi:hypothetical protein